MADNVATQSALLATIPTATSIATDQLPSGDHVQYMKLMDGTPDGTTKAIVGALGLQTDPGDRAGRQLGIVASITAAVVLAAGAALIGSVKLSDGVDTALVSAAGELSVDVSDRVGRALGVVASITNPVAVTGTFWQATQPVSGTFWQATQPVSLAAAVDVSDRAARALGVVASITAAVDVSDRAARLVGRVYGSQGQQLVQTATNFNLQSEIAVGATLIDPRSIRALTASDVVTAAQGTKGTVANAWPGLITDGVDTALVSAAGALLVEGATLTKGTQGATGFSIQALKDSGRVNIMWTMEVSPAVVADTLQTVTESRDGAATTTFTTKVVTSGKRLRLLAWNMAVENTLGVNPKRAKLRLRFNTAGAVTAASPLQANLVASVATAVNTVGTTASGNFPDGCEYLGDGTKQIGFSLEFPDWVTAAQTGKCYITIFAYEY